MLEHNLIAANAAAHSRADESPTSNKLEDSDDLYFRLESVAHVSCLKDKPGDTISAAWTPEKLETLR